MKHPHNALNKALIKLLIFIALIVTSCSSTEVNFQNLTDDYLRNEEAVLGSPLNQSKIPNDKALVMSRVVFYIDGQPLVKPKKIIELGFVPIDKFIDTEQRIKHTVFYPLKRDKQGYFFLLLDRTPLVLSYVYLKDDNKIHKISGGAVLNLSEDIKKAYSGEIHIINGINKNSDNAGEYSLNTLIQFYYNYNDGTEYLKKTYSKAIEDVSDIHILPFITP
jgi:hypothetical protein